MGNPVIGSGTVDQVYQEVRGYEGGSLRGDKITSQELAALREAFARTSDGILGIGNQQESFLEGLAGDNESLAAALRDPNMDYTGYLQLRSQELTARQAVFDAGQGNDISASELEALRQQYGRTPEGSAERQSLLESIGKNASLVAAVQDPSISYTQYRSMRGAEEARKS